LVQRLRFRQKSSLLRIPGTVDLALGLLDNGHQVAISVAFKETLKTIVDLLGKAGHRCAVIHGELPPAEKERERMAFQRGDVQIVLFTVTEGISLHQGEHNDVPRSMVVHDLRWSAIDMAQVEGRCHRDGKFAQVYWMLAPGTIDATIAETVVGRIKSMKTMVGDNTNTIDAIEQALTKL
jgi:superfamily II DNA/RNA helicase